MNILELSFGNFELYPDVIIGRIKEGIHFDMKLNTLLTDQLISHYGDNHKLGYISIRENSYSVDPMVHLHNTKYENLCSVSIVETKILGMSSVALESKFFKSGKLKSFINAEDALIWTNNQILNSFNEVILPSYQSN